MQSRWYELKPAALLLRQNGKSLSFIEANLGIPRSTLNGWFKDIRLTEEQLRQLRSNKLEALSQARLKAAETHRAQKDARLEEAKARALKTLSLLPADVSVTELALAMLYWGEGRKTQMTALASMDPAILRFFIGALQQCYGVDRPKLIGELHLRKDQDPQIEVSFWAKTLGIPDANFKGAYFDKRTSGASYEGYHGVCLVRCPGIAIQRRLVYLYTLFSERVGMGD